MTEIELKGRALVSGPPATAEVVYTDRPLSFWGGFDPSSGRVVDRHHPLAGVVVRHRVFALPGGRGSSTASLALLEAVRVDQAPAALVVSRMDPIIALGLVVAEELYYTTRTLVLLSPEDFDRLKAAVSARVDPDGTVHALMRDSTDPA